VSPDSVSYQQLLGIFACLALALVAHLESLPVWVLVTVGVSGGIRLLLARRGRPAPPRGCPEMQMTPTRARDSTRAPA